MELTTPNDSERLNGGNRRPLNDKVAVSVSDVTFTYHASIEHGNVLKRINVTVPQGKIYALLGSSGCGKTTLLRCMLGRLKPQNGSVYIFGKIPGSENCSVPGPGVGYMPQETALFPEFTIKETLRYFGQIYQMSSLDIKTRTMLLIDLLDLPKKRRSVESLSGGQQRRVSLACALIHTPPLLILDEPTVGLDPVLRVRIWQYLDMICNENGLTVIITTHYIEEARNADNVGLMRYGRLLSQSNPDVLLARHKLSTLEDVFFKLCQIDTEHGLKGVQAHDNLFVDVDVEPATEDPSINHSETSTICEPSEVAETRYQKVYFSWYRVWALFLKNMIRLTRSYFLFAFFVLLPACQISLFSMTVQKDANHIPVAVYSPEKPANLSAKYLSYISSTKFTQIRFDSLEKAEDLVYRGKAYAAVHIPKNYTFALNKRHDLLINADNATISSSNIKLYIDMTNQLVGWTVVRNLMQAFRPFAEEILVGLGYNPAVFTLPISVQDPIFGQSDPSVALFVAPGMLVLISFYSTTAITALALVLERKDGLLERGLAAGVQPIEFLVSHIFSNLVVLTLQEIALLITAFHILRFPSEGPLWLVILLSFSQGAAGVMFGLFVSSMCKDEVSAFMLGISVFFPTMLVGGMFWPIQSMPGWAYSISYFLPQTLAVDSLRSILNRGWALLHPEVLVGFIVSWVWIVLLLIAALFAFHKVT